MKFKEICEDVCKLVRDIAHTKEPEMGEVAEESPHFRSFRETVYRNSAQRIAQIEVERKALRDEKKEKRALKDAVDSIKNIVSGDTEKEAEIKRLKIEIMNSRERARLELEEKIEQLDEYNYSLVLETDRLKATIHLRDEEIKQLKGEKAKEVMDVRCANCVDRYKINPVPTRCKDCLDPTGELKYPYFRPKKKE